MEFDHDTETITPDNPTDLLTIGGVGALTVPVGTTLQRPPATNGLMRYNIDVHKIEWVLNDLYVQTVPYDPSNISITSGNISGVTLGSDVTGVTQSPGNNSLQLSTTAYVDAAVASAVTINPEVLAFSAAHG
jgi:hypothetical protein